MRGYRNTVVDVVESESGKFTAHVCMSCAPLASNHCQLTQADQHLSGVCELGDCTHLIEAWRLCICTGNCTSYAVFYRLNCVLCSEPASVTSTSGPHPLSPPRRAFLRQRHFHRGAGECSALATVLGFANYELLGVATTFSP